MIVLVRTIDTKFFSTHFLADNDELKRKTIAKLHAFRREFAIVPNVALHEIYKFEFQKKFGRESAYTQSR